MFGFLKNLFGGNRAAYEGGYPPIGGKFEFPFVDGKLLLYAIKADSQPTKEDVEHMVSHSILNEIEQLRDLKFICETCTLKQIRGFNEGIKWKAPPNQKDWILEAQVAVLAMSQAVMKEHGAL